ncbi:NAD(P)-dependent oxidoreductase [Pseudobacter ginsenosidimutans]|uniref:Alanine dehydrogenase n=1 Tax=Pseudobacter ginsenosidimutans TaxID=661488 RepID=A0A4Q7N1M3_9BACT|nr:NAD(P)-dependent oxidoreductase [Pseudobacter ginsenosidimutans]QEC43842.1 alanine dehydrogenase [Pseudobacter ginsenosidimutans]RZS75263.1 alanine dehydrogenase [Pseudobacter ginsenosidimutans]
MIRLGLIREGKTPADNRVALTPAQCKWIHKNSDEVRIFAQSSPGRCFSDKEYRAAGIEVVDDISDCDILLGIKEVPVSQLIPNKTYLFFSHTRKKQSYNQELFQSIISSKITLIDYECLEHEDGQRILGFGFFAGVVGAHNGMMGYGHRSGAYDLVRVYRQRSFRELIHTYFGLRIPPVKVAVTGSGRVAHGILEIMNLMGIVEVEPEDYLLKKYSYPVYTQLKGAGLYERKTDGAYNRVHFHDHPSEYNCKFLPYAMQSDILMNGIYWDTAMPRLFEREAVQDPAWRLHTIADITDDAFGSVPINLGDQTIEDPVYGVSKTSFKKTAPYLPGSVDVMAVGNLPNELPRDASRYFGEQLIKYVLEDLVKNNQSDVIERATMVKEGVLTSRYYYLADYAAGK